MLTFTTLFNHATVSVPNAQGAETNPLYIDAFGTVQDILGLVDSNKYHYQNMVCDWNKMYSTPNVKTDNVYNNFAFMQGNSNNPASCFPFILVLPAA